MTPAAIAVKAEAVFGVFVTLRHRTVKLVLLLAAAVALLATVSGGEASDPTTVLVIAASLGAVAGPRVLAPGSALDAARRAAGPWWLHPAGRLVGVAVLVVPVSFGAGALLGGDGGEWPTWSRLGVAAAGAALALGSVTMALAPLLGATAAGTVGLVLAWFGGVPPSGMAAVFGGWPWLARPVTLAWNALPLGWRAARWLQRGGAGDPLLLGCWIALGVALAAWAAGRWYRRDRFLAGSRVG
ncbi:MAG: hypothetical protein PVF27_10120 [Gemmatimonadales bacterium]